MLLKKRGNAKDRAVAVYSGSGPAEKTSIQFLSVSSKNRFFFVPMPAGNRCRKIALRL